MAFLSQMAAV